MGQMEDSVATIEDANAEALRRLLAAEPVLAGARPAGEVIPGLEDHVMLHAGPPIGWERMCGPMKSAVMGAAVFEGWAAGPEEAEDMAAAGIRYSSIGRPPPSATV